MLKALLRDRSSSNLQSRYTEAQKAASLAAKEIQEVMGRVWLAVKFVLCFNKQSILAPHPPFTWEAIECHLLHCNCNYILFTKLPWPGDSEGIFRSSSQAATCTPAYHTRRRLHTVPFKAERQAGKL